MEIYINYSFIAWTALLAYLARRNANLGSLLIVMMIPKLLDMLLLTPMLQPLKTTEYRQWFYIIHALNDTCMVLVIKFRWVVSEQINIKSIYRKLAIEKYIISIYLISIIYNILVFGDFYHFWQNNFGTPKSFFFFYYDAVKELLTSIEAITLTVLTIQTIIAIKQLKQKGLID